MPSLNLHRVKTITKRIKKLDSDTFVLTIVVKNETDTFEICIFSDKPENLTILNTLSI